MSEQHREGASRFLIWPSALRRPIETVDLLAAVDRKAAADARLAAHVQAAIDRTPPLTEEVKEAIAEILRPRPSDTPPR